MTKYQLWRTTGEEGSVESYTFFPEESAETMRAYLAEYEPTAELVREVEFDTWEEAMSWKNSFMDGENV